MACCFGVASFAADPASELEMPIEDYERDHWSFRAIEAVDVPRLKEDWASGSLDRFVLAQQSSRELRPAPRAARDTLLRRVTIDLTGLPPTPDEIDRYLNDEHPDAFARVVDRLLASPEYGRRWGQFWLDLARFAETDGFEHDRVRKSAWQYRDWVIDALNEDLGYDRFVAMQVAGDILYPESAQASIATAFCLSGPDMPDINSQVERKHVLLNEITSTVGAVFLSLQIGCAQCHDHKYDPISQADFYRLRAYFEPAIKLKSNQSVTVLSANADSGVTTKLYRRGDWRSPAESVTASVPRIVASGSVSERPAPDRRGLAKWLTDKSNPLVARSIVNRIWQQHFGKGLSGTPSDFGLIGDTPSHPQLLDHLASGLRDNGWSLKWLHREMLLSSTYQTTSLPPRNLEVQREWNRALSLDPTNRWMTRFARRRLDAESIRDCLFAVSESLNGESGGPGARPPLPVELVKTLKAGQWKVTPREADHYRRSVYLFARRNLRYPLFATFDRPAANCSCAERHESTTATQSLSLLNSELTMDACRRLVIKIRSEQASLRGQCASLHLRVLGRVASPSELDELEIFAAEQTRYVREQNRAEPEVAALIDLSLALLNSNAFLYVD